MQYEQLVDYVLGRIGMQDWRLALRSERGAISTETAVVTFLLVVIAVAVGAILWSAAQGQANNIPTTTTNPTN